MNPGRVLVLANIANLGLILGLVLGMLGRSDFAARLSMASLTGLVALGPFIIAAYGTRLGWTSWVVLVSGGLHLVYVAMLHWGSYPREGDPR